MENETLFITKLSRITHDFKTPVMTLYSVGEILQKTLPKLILFYEKNQKESDAELLSAAEIDVLKDISQLSLEAAKNLNRLVQELGKLKAV